MTAKSSSVKSRSQPTNSNSNKNQQANTNSPYQHRYDRYYRPHKNDPSYNRNNQFRNPVDNRDGYYNHRSDRQYYGHEDNYHTDENDGINNCFYNNGCNEYTYNQNSEPDNNYRIHGDANRNYSSADQCVEESRNRHKDYYRQNHDQEDVSMHDSIRSGSTNTDKRSFEENNNDINDQKSVPNITAALEDLKDDGSPKMNIISSLLTMLQKQMDNGNKKTYENKANGSKFKRQKSNKSNNQGRNPTYNGLPIYLIEDECDVYRTASNGNQFKIVMQLTPNHGKLPVPIWKDDNRSHRDIMNYAKANKRSRCRFNAIAKQLNKQTAPTSETSDSGA